jgi:DNA replication protein DnaC
MTQISNEKIKSYLESLAKSKEEATKNFETRRVFINITGEDFKQIMKIECEIEILKRGLKKEFLIDNENREILFQLYFYLTGSPQFKGNLDKGILLSGSIGVGKTLILNSFCNIIEAFSQKRITRFNSKRIAPAIIEKEAGFYDKRPLFIDDLGREQKEINDYGTKEQPLIDLFSVRYDLGSWTFATTNFGDETLSSFYGAQIFDRFKEMFNFLYIKGESKREK